MSMRLFIRLAMAIALIVGDAAQAASLVAIDSRGDEGGAASYTARAKQILDRDEKSWKRISASICTGCGTAPPPLEIASAVPNYLKIRRAAAAEQTDKTVEAMPQQAVPQTQSVALRSEQTARPQAARPNRSRTRLSARARKYARYARLRLIRRQMRLARLHDRSGMRPVRLSQTRRRARTVQVSVLELNGRWGDTQNSRNQPVPVPLPPSRPAALCAYDRGLVTAEAKLSVACTSSQ